MTALPGLLVDYVVVLLLVITGASLGGAPAYLLDEVVGLPEWVAWAIGTALWALAVTVIAALPSVDAAVHAAIDGYLGVGIPSPVTVAFAGLFVMYAIGTLEAGLVPDEPETR